jgi:hypothetical protein
MFKRNVGYEKVRKKIQWECYLDVLETVGKKKDNPYIFIFKAGGTRAKVKTIMEGNFWFQFGFSPPAL